MLSIARDAGASLRDRMQAVGWLAERGFGRSTQVDQVAGGWFGEIDFERLTIEELKSLREILAKADPGR